MNRSKLEIIYSIGVLIAIPAIVIVNTLIITQTMNESFGTELRRKAELANSIVIESSIDLIKDKNYTKLQSNLDDLESNEPAMRQSALISSNNGSLDIVAQSSSSSKSFNKVNASIVYATKRSISVLVDVYDKNSNLNQAWNTMTPVLDANNNVIAIFSSNFLTADAQEAINASYQKSFIALVVSVILIVALLFRHFRLVGYAQLLAKQKEVNQTMSDFLSVATHELRAPTTIIKGYISNVTDGSSGAISPDIKSQLDVALSQTERLTSLVQDLLNVSRVEQGKIQYNITSVDTIKILNLVVDNFQSIAKTKGLEIIFKPTDEISLVSADEGRVQEIFTNLIDNAIKYTAKGTITITQKQSKNSVITSIRDTGFGISPEARDRLFQRFYRVKTDLTENVPGTGLGLWIIKQYIEAMGGKISLETMEGVGSNFIVEFKKHF